MTIDEQLTYLKKGLSELIREDELKERLIQSAKTGKPPERGDTTPDQITVTAEYLSVAWLHCMYSKRPI